MRIAVLGAAGQLGRDLCPRLATLGDVIPLSRADIDLAQPDTITVGFSTHRPDVFVNCAAYNFVDKAETERKAAMAVNAEGVFLLAQECARHGTKLVHFSTDYVFGQDAVRTTPYTEDDRIGPVNAYARGKETGEEFARLASRDNLVIRTCGLLGWWGSGGKGGNFVETMLRLADPSLLASLPLPPKAGEGLKTEDPSPLLGEGQKTAGPLAPPSSSGKGAEGVRLPFDPSPLASLAAPPLKREGQKPDDSLAPPSSSGKGAGGVRLPFDKPIRVVNDQRCTPSYTADVADATVQLIAQGATGLFHVVNSGDCTWYEFAAEIFRQSGLKPNLTPITTAEFGAAAKRPAYSVLSTAKLAAFLGSPLRPWPEALASYLVERRNKQHHQTHPTHASVPNYS